MAEPKRSHMRGVFLNFFYYLRRLCSSNSLEMERNEPIHLEDLNSRASSSTTTPPVGNYEGGTKKMEGNDYEVFLSFRGKDTRKGFTDYLYTSLIDVGIHVFKDDNELRVGEEIGSELLCSIEQSKILIPIISEDYASSKWCLRELAHILKCKRNRGQIVLPIFYKVKPSQLRNPIGRLRYAINAHKKNLDKMVAKEWEEALKEVSFLKGWESEKDENGHEGSLVKTVVRKVMSELKRFFLLNVPEQLVGTDDRVAEIMSKIDATFNGTWIIGIYGMGGIGKTTLAKVLYNKLSSHFEGRSFLANIRETSYRKGIKRLQKQLISDILGNSFDVSNVDEGISVIKSRFTSKKILILLDDIDDITQLNALVRDHSWFKAGSIIIITTRNKRILDEARADHVYPLNELPSDKSLILFSRHAFRKDSPQSDYEVISRDVVYTTGGLPLAIEIIGSFLCGKTKKVWNDTLKKLKKVPDKKVQETLMISYDALEYEEQQIFLDIACVFIGLSKEIPTYMWHDCDFFPEKGIEVLHLMSLIKIDEDGILMMHDQLRDLGREIVRRENQREPQKRSRLWIREEATDVIDNNKGTSEIEILCLSKYNRRSYTAEKFKKLTNLRVLHLDGGDLTGDFQNLLPQLRWLEWRDCCLDFEAANFHPKKLIMLVLWQSRISEDWGGWGPLKMSTKLKVLHLNRCALRTTPDLSAFRSLEVLIVEYCEDLEEIHPSINDIKTLVSLDVNNCSKLKELPLGVGRMEELRELFINGTDIREISISINYLMKLETLNASNCGLLAQLPESLGSLVSLTQLDLSNTGIEELPESIGYLKKLETLNASYCASLSRIPISIGHLESLSLLNLKECFQLAQLPDSIGSLATLQCLLLSSCCSLREIPSSIGKLVSLIELDLKSIAIEELPESIGSLKELKILDASYCASLSRIPNSIGHLASLSLLNLKECVTLAQLPDSIGSLATLQHLLLSGCCSLREIPDSIGKLTSLIELDLKSTAIKELPESIGYLTELKILDVSCCASLVHIPSSISHLASLSLLNLEECIKLAQLPDSIGSLATLQCLLSSSCRLLREIPGSIGKLVSLTKLDLKFTAIEELPESIGSLKELETLDASYCASLSRIPSSIGHLASLSLLNLKECNKIAQLPDTIGSLMCLQRLLLSECHFLREIPDSIRELKSLTELRLNSTAIEELPESIGSLKELKTLDASYCASLACIPSSVGHLASLSLLDLRGCDKLARLPDSMGSLASLQCLLLSGCHSLREIPESIGKLTLLTELDLKSTAIIELPESIGNMQNLRMLDISGTPMTELLDDRGILVELQELRTSGGKNPEGPGELVSPDNLDLDKLQKLSELHSRVLALVLLKCPKTPPANNLAMDYQTADSECVLKRPRPFGISKDPPAITIFGSGNATVGASLGDRGAPVAAMVGMDSESMADVKPRIVDELGDKSRIWKLTEINEPVQCRSIRLPDNLTTMRVSRLIYRNSGLAILALSSNAVHKLWKWEKSVRNLTGRATTSVVPQLWQPPGGNLMTNDACYTNPEDAVPCFALSKNDCYLISASGGKISLFNMITFMTMTTFMPPPPPNNDIIAIGTEDSSIQIYDVRDDEVQTKLKGDQRIVVGFDFSTFFTVLMSYGSDSQTITTFIHARQAATFLAFLPRDNNIIAIGMEDSSIQIYHVQVNEVETILRGHQKRITGIAFSDVLNVLVSSGADSQLCVWSTDGWEKNASKFLQMPTGRGAPLLANTRVQFHVDQIHLLVVHETQIATYEAPKLECLEQWVTRQASGPITDATYSCNCQSIYASFEDGSIGVLTASTLRLRCLINPAAYIPPNPSLRAYPLVIAAHPSEPNQFALGLTDGGVYVLEPLESKGEWGDSPPVEDSAGPSTTSGATGSDQPQR